jgi:predicted esterase
MTHCARSARAFASALALVASTARGEVTLAPSPDGYVGAFLVAGPFDESAPLDLATIRPCLGKRVPGADAVSWQLADGGTAVLDVGRAIGDKAPRAVTSALVGGVLVSSAPTDGLLLLSADGAAQVVIDGRTVFRRAAPHARGGAWDPIPVKLDGGAHAVVVALTKGPPGASLAMRWLARSDLSPWQARWTLPGTAEADAARLAPRLAAFEVTAGLVPGGYQPRARVSFPRGAPVDPKLHATVALAAHGAPLGATVDLGVLGGAAVLETSLPSWSTADLEAATTVPEEARVKVGSFEHVSPLRLIAAAPKAVSRALSLRDALASGRYASLADRAVVSATLEQGLADLATSSDEGGPRADELASGLTAFVDRVEGGGDPLFDPGVHAFARTSPADGRPEPLLLHVPAGYRAGDGKKYPLVVVLHGLGSTPERVLTAFLGTDSRAPHPRVDGFVLAPNAHGDAFYRGPGELDAMDLVDWVRRTYPIDPARVAITGHSMGGTGATELGFRYPDVFGAVGALAGYHSYFVRRDVRGRPLRAWEWAELVRWSPASFAENARDMWLFVAQGTRDLPLVHSTSLTARYKELGYPFKDLWPDTGHDVWRVAWGDAALWAPLTAHRSAIPPQRVTLKTDAFRYASRAWVHVTGFERVGVPAEIDATAVSRDSIHVTTKGVAAFALDRPAPLVADRTRVVLEVDGTRLVFEGATPIAAQREGGSWVPGTPPREAARLTKAAGLEGPIRDAYMGPLAFVYGTLDPAEERAAREVALFFRARYSGNAEYPVFADVAAPKDIARTHSLFLVGSKDANRLVRDLDGELPLGISGGAIRAGGVRLGGDAETGFACIYPNPESPSRYVVLVEARDARGLFRSMSLPLNLPDFIAFDSGLAPAAGQQVLGAARVLAAGYFDSRWSLPADLSDRVAVPPARDAGTWTPLAARSR